MRTQIIIFHIEAIYEIARDAFFSYVWNVTLAHHFNPGILQPSVGRQGPRNPGL